MEITQPVQLWLLDVCDCCGGLYVPDDLNHRHKACNRAWDVWLRTDNHDDWWPMPRRTAVK
jgi:hypothetical protein